MKRLNMLIALIVGFSLTSVAYGKRARREGFNFGLGVRALDTNDDTKGIDGGSDSSKISGVQTVSPFMGYVLTDHLNLGLAGLFESETTQENYVSQDGTQEIQRETTSSLKGGSLFLRFLFADMMYFEGGFGVYERRQKFVDEYYTRTGSGEFSGERDEYSLRGMGPGYHLGVGLEIAITNGFFFTTSFVYRAVQLRDYKGTGSIGTKRSRLEKRELNFGLSHYVN